MAGSQRVSFVLILLSVGLLALPAGAQDLASWFAQDPRASAFAGIRAQLEGLFETARLQGVPEAPLVDKLREGASKGVEGPRLVAALRETMDRLLEAQRILERASGPAAGEDVQALSLLLARGLPGELAGALIASGLRAGRDLPAVRAACDAVLGLAAVAGLGSEDTLTVGLQVGTLLLNGRLPVSAYETLAAVFLKGKAAGLEDGEILNDVIIATLASGGGFVAMNEKITRGQALKASRGRPVRPPQAGPKDGPPGREKDKDKDK